MALISIVLPVYDEEGCLPAMYGRLAALRTGSGDRFEFIFVNDGSRDRSLDIMRELAQRDPDVRFISFSRNFGHEAASTAGMEHARGDAIVLIDADLQDPPELIPELVARWRQGSDVVYARRRNRAGETVFKRTSSWLFGRLLNALTDIRIPPDTGDFRLMDRRVVEAVARCHENPRFVRGLVSWVGFKQDEVLYDRAERLAGETKYNLVKLLSLSWEAVCSFSLIPLRAAVYLGAVVTALSLGLAAYILIQKLLFQMPFQGYALLACGMFFLSGVILLTLGIIAQYIGHIFRHTQNRPIYIVESSGGWPLDAQRPDAANAHPPVLRETGPSRVDARHAAVGASQEDSASATTTDRSTNCSAEKSSTGTSRSPNGGIQP